MRFGSLFTGAGGFDVGLEAAGLSCAWQVEIDPTARAVLARHWPDVPRFEDVRECSKANLSPVDVLVGGWPCQDLSVAGARKGLSGERSGLFHEYARLAAELRPRVLLFENVPGLFSSFTPVRWPTESEIQAGEWEVEEDSDFETVLHALGEFGYYGSWRVLDAEGFGVAQSRGRVFGVFLEGRSGADRSLEILALAEGVRGDPAQGKAKGQDVAGALGGGSGERGWCDDLDRAGAFVCERAGTKSPGAHPGGFNGQDVGNLVAYAAKTAGCPSGSGGADDNDAQAGRLVAFTELGESHATYQEAETAIPLRTNGGGGSQKSTLVAFGGNDTSGERRVAAALTTKGNRLDFDTENFVCVTGAVTHPLTSEGADASEDGTGRGTPIVAQCHGSNVGPMGTLRAGNGNETGGIPFVANGSYVRRLTPRECERLMGWPDDHTRWRADGREIADGPRYRLIGNGVVAPVAAWIGRRLIAVLEHTA